jgi:hypothetical protein
VTPLLQGKQDMERIVVERYHSSLFPQHIRERIGTDRTVKVTIEESDIDDKEATEFDQAVISAVADLDGGKAISAEAALAALFVRFGPPRESTGTDNSLKLYLAPSAEACLHQFGAEIRDARLDHAVEATLHQFGIKASEARSASTELNCLLGHFLERSVDGYTIQVPGISDLIISEYRMYYVTHRLKGDVREIVRISRSDHDVKGYRFSKKLTALEWSKLGVDVTYPIAVVEDRYSGTYSGGRWLAIAGADAFENGLTRVAFCVEDGPGPSGQDGDARDFWSEPPHWIAAGDTADAAIENLRKRVISEEASEI